MNDPYLSSWQRTQGEFAGSVVGSLIDPVTIGSLFVGGAYGVGKTVLSRILGVVAAEAALNAGTEALVETGNYQWRKDAGIQVSLEDSMKQIGMAGLLGGVVGGVFGAGRELAHIFPKGNKAFKEAVNRAEKGSMTARDVQIIAESHEVPLSDVDQRMLKLAEEQDELDHSAFGIMNDITPDDSVSLKERALISLEDDELVSPVWGADYAPSRDSNVDRVVTENLVTDVDRLSVYGKPVYHERLDPNTVKTDATSYQYKGGGDATGVTDRLRDVKQWDPTASGQVFVHERADGRYIADGHQRLALARKLKAEGDPSINLHGFVYREADGWSAADVRALAAKKNLQEGSGSVMDAARVIRDRPDIVDDGLPVSGPLMKKATSLARLSNDAWYMVVNGVADEHHGAVVGRLVSDPLQHHPILADVARLAPETERQTEMLVRELQAAGFRYETQADMFGSMQVQRSLMMERVKVLEEALKALRQDKKLFASLSDNAEVIEAAGNRLDDAGNVNRAVNAETLAGLIDRLARSRGIISDALTSAATRFAEGSTAKKEARLFIRDVEQAINEKGIARILQGDEPQVLKPVKMLEPADSASVEFAELQRLESGGGVEPTLNAEGQLDVWDIIPDGNYADDLAKAKKIEITANIIKTCKR